MSIDLKMKESKREDAGKMNFSSSNGSAWLREKP
jgi:hypothetical protein